MENTRKPLIGVLSLIDYEKKSYWMLPGYMDGILRAGGIPVMLPLTNDPSIIKQLVKSYDGFLFTGGQDVSPWVYNDINRGACGETSDARDRMELALFNMAYDADKPILGICRGIQFINAAMGGTLWQDLPSEYPCTAEHHQNPPYDIPSHSVKIMKGSPLEELLSDLLSDGNTLMVNSYHHQAVRYTADGLKIMAVSEDGLTEALYDDRKSFLWAVQWHPEFSYRSDESSIRIFSRFTAEAARNII